MTRLLATLAIVTWIAGTGCADVRAGKSFTTYDEFENQSRTGVELGSLSGDFGSSIGIHGLALAKTTKADKIAYVLSGSIYNYGSSTVPLWLDSVKIKLDEHDPVEFRAAVGRRSAGIEPFAIDLNDAFLRRMAEANTIEMRFHGHRVYTNAYSLTDRQRQAVQMFYHVHVLGRSEQEFKPQAGDPRR